MAYKLIAIDLDDTLLTAKKEISPLDWQAISRAQEAGIHVALASGRAYQGMVGIRNDLNLTGCTISSGGAIVTDNNGKQVYTCCLPSKMAKQLMQYASDKNLYFQLYLENNFYYTKRTRQTGEYEQACHYTGIEDPSIMELAEVHPSKILIIEEPETIEAARIEINRLFPEIRTVFSQRDYLEMHNTSVSKGKALEFLASLLYCKPDEVLAIGDSEIDLSMLHFAGTGVAVANAGEAVLQAADYITSSCEESGVAHAINKFVFGE